MFNDLSIFTSIVDAGNFLQASKNLNTSQATVSRRLQALEEELKVSLIIRNTRGFQLTKAGERLYKEVKEQQIRLSNTIDEIRREKNQTTGKLRIALPVVLAYIAISPYIAKFMREHPNIELEINYHNHHIDLLKEHFDLAIVNYSPKQQTLLIRKIYTVTVGVYCTPEYISRYGKPESLEKIDSNHLFIGNMRYDLTAQNISYTHQFNKNNSQLNHARIFSNNALHNKQIAASGHAIAGGWDELYADELASGQFIKILTNYDFGEFSFYMIRLDNTSNSTLETFINFIDNCFARIKNI